MIVFKPRLALFYVITLVIVALLTNRLSISSQSAMALPEQINSGKTNVETSK